MRKDTKFNSDNIHVKPEQLKTPIKTCVKAVIIM